MILCVLVYVNRGVRSVLLSKRILRNSSFFPEKKTMTKMTSSFQVRNSKCPSLTPSAPFFMARGGAVNHQGQGDKGKAQGRQGTRNTT